MCIGPCSKFKKMFLFARSLPVYWPLRQNSTTGESPASSTKLAWKDGEGEDRMGGGKKSREQGKRVCVQVWGVVRWIAQPGGQLITVSGRVRSGARERGKERWESGRKKKEEEDGH